MSHFRQLGETAITYGQNRLGVIRHALEENSLHDAFIHVTGFCIRARRCDGRISPSSLALRSCSIRVLWRSRSLLSISIGYWWCIDVIRDEANDTLGDPGDDRAKYCLILCDPGQMELSFGLCNAHVRIIFPKIRQIHRNGSCQLYSCC